jgi:hypothetical protein
MKIHDAAILRQDPADELVVFGGLAPTFAQRIEATTRSKSAILSSTISAKSTSDTIHYRPLFDFSLCRRAICAFTAVRWTSAVSALEGGL